MAIKGIRSFHYMTNQPEEAKNFYMEALGFKLDYEQSGWIAFKMDEVQVALHPEEQKIPEIPKDSHGAHMGGCLKLTSDNISEDRKRLEKFGAKILGEADEPWGHMLTFEDLDGNILHLMNPKY